MIDFNLLQDFMEEAYEHLEEMETSLLKMEESPDNDDILNDIFRSVHTIKGAAQFVGIDRISELTHKLENLLDRLRQKDLAPSMGVVDLLIAGKDRISALARELEQHQEERSPIEDLLSQIEQVDATGSTEAAPSETPATGETADPVKTSTSEFTDFLGDFFEEPAAILDGGIIDEENDAELFTIFIDQLREGLSSLARLETDPTPGDGLVRYLTRSDEIVRGLSSAANYMGYEKLTAFYSRWMEVIASERERVESGGELSSDLHGQWVRALLDTFPDAAPSEGSKVPVDAGAATADASDDGEVEAAIDDLFGDIPTDDPEVTPAELLAGEDWEEDQDAELFGIFQSQIAEAAASFRRMDVELHQSDDPIGVLTRCIDTIDTLSSAANYMGYEKLTGFYSQWQSVLSSAQEQIQTGGHVPADINEPWLQALLGNFSISEEQTVAADVEEKKPATPPPDAPDADPDWVSAASLLQKEVIDEEQDAELYEIFIGQLTEGLEELDRLNEALSTSTEPPQLLEACEEILQRLLLAANYMGYDHLSEFYGRWQSRIGSAVENARAGAGVTNAIILPWTRALREKFAVPSAATGEETVPSHESAVNQLIGDLLREASAQDIEALLQKEDFEEEYDAELFNIFHEQLIEGVDELQRLTAQLASTDDSAGVLLECTRSLERMSSSANYMGYDHLIRFYELWQEKIEGARSLVQAGEEIPADINDMWMEALLTRFPEAIPRKEGEVSDVSNTAPKIETLEETPIGSQHETLEGAHTSEDDPMFRKLSLAFDSDQAHVAPGSDETIDDVIQEMLAVGNGKLPVFETTSDAGPIEKPEADERLREPAAPNVPEAAPTPAPEASQTVEPKAPVDSAGSEETIDPMAENAMTGSKIADEGKSAPVEVEAGRTSERAVRQSIRVDADKIDYLMNEVGELVVSRAYFFQLFNEMRVLQQEFKETFGLDQKELKPLRELTFRLGEASVALGRVSNELQEGVMKVRMLPVSQLFNRYPRLVRDLVHHTDKKVKLEVRGEETELDKMIIEEISDPLIHLIRNAVDHGIEPAAEREAMGKSPEGHLLLEAYHESNHIVIEISDDGRGVDPARIRNKALEKGLHSAEELERMTNSELYQMIMLPGFSTASVATKTSGRGVGMDVVKKNIEKLNGTFEVESTVGKGTMMRIKIPLTLAIIQALMVRVGQDLFTIPLPAVEETLKISQDETTTIEGVEVIHIRETTMPIFRLRSLFGIEEQEDRGDEFFVVIVSAGNQHVGLVVDQLIGQEEVVIKPMADYLREESGFSGATIIGDGKVSLILDVHDLVKLAAKRNTIRRRTRRKFGHLRVAEAQHG